MLRGALLVTVRCSAVSSGAGCSLLAQIADLECTGITQELVKDLKVLIFAATIAPSVNKRVKTNCGSLKC